jgi:hypothetical protein
MRRSLIVVVLIFSLACPSSVAPPTGEMGEAYVLLEDAKDQAGETYAPREIQDARSFYQRAEKEFQQGRRERADDFG